MSIPLGDGLHYRVVAQMVVVVEVLVAQGNGLYALSQHGLLPAPGEARMARVGDAGTNGLDKAEAFINLAKQQASGV